MGSSWHPLRILDRYVLRRMCLVFSLVFSSLLLVFYIINILELIDNIIENKVPFSYVLKYDYYLTPEIVTIILPISVLTAVLLTFSLMSKNNEVIAVQVSGISLLRLALPAVFFGLFLSLGASFIQENVLPEANRTADPDAGRDPQAQIVHRHRIRQELGAGPGTTRSIFITFLEKSKKRFSQFQHRLPGPRISACAGASSARYAALAGGELAAAVRRLRQEFSGQFPRPITPLSRSGGLEIAENRSSFTQNIKVLRRHEQPRTEENTSVF